MSDSPQVFVEPKWHYSYPLSPCHELCFDLTMDKMRYISAIERELSPTTPTIITNLHKHLCVGVSLLMLLSQSRVIRD
jgi:hypothetical protein